jgi:hypothetical protein
MSRTIQQQICSDAADFFEQNPTKWTKCAHARDAKQRPVDPLSKDAESFCAIGLLQRRGNERGFDFGRFPDLAFGSLVVINDAGNREAVIMYLRARADGKPDPFADLLG